MFVSFLVSFNTFNPPCFWNNLYDNNARSVCVLLRVEECIFDSILSKCCLIRHTIVKGNNTIPLLKDNWRSFIAEHELNNIEIEISKVNNGVDNSRINVTFLRIGKIT